MIDMSILYVDKIQFRRHIKISPKYIYQQKQSVVKMTGSEIGSASPTASIGH